jgi:hypothetical protein
MDQRYYNAVYGRFMVVDPHGNGLLASSHLDAGFSNQDFLTSLPDWLSQDPDFRTLTTGLSGNSDSDDATEEPEPEETGEWNRFAYVADDPTNYVDPAGTARKPTETRASGGAYLAGPTPSMVAGYLKASSIAAVCDGLKQGAWGLGGIGIILRGPWAIAVKLGAWAAAGGYMYGCNK